MRRLCGLVLVAATVVCQGAATAQDAGDFYRHTTITLTVGSGVGGGYDAYARLFARHFGRFLPGTPTVVVQNMSGAGGLRSANNLYAAAPKDGSTIGIMQNTLTLNQLGGGQSVSYDMRRFNWLGSMNGASTICAFSPAAGIRTAQDLLSREVVIGASAGSTGAMPALLNGLVGTRFKIVRGYDTTGNIVMATETGEVAGLCGWGWDGAQAQARDYFARGALQVGLDIASTPDPGLHARGVPFVMDLVPEGEAKQALALILSTQLYGRPIAAPPGVPADRLALLRRAFAATLVDPAFLKEAATGQMDIVFLQPDELDRQIHVALDASPAVKQKALDELQKSGWGGL